MTICALAGFAVMRCTDPDGSRSHIGALLLGYYTDDKSGRAGFGSEPNRMFAAAVPARPRWRMTELQ